MEKKKIILSGLLCILLLSGCKGSDNGGAGANSAYNLTADSFTVSSTRTMSNSEFIANLNNSDDFMYEEMILLVLPRQQLL